MAHDTTDYTQLQSSFIYCSNEIFCDVCGALLIYNGHASWRHGINWQPMFQDAGTALPAGEAVTKTKMESRRKRRRLGAMQYRCWTEDFAEASIILRMSYVRSVLLHCFMVSGWSFPRVLLTQGANSQSNAVSSNIRHPIVLCQWYHMLKASCWQSSCLWWHGQVIKLLACGIRSLQADMVFTEDQVEKVIAETPEDLLPIRATKMPRLRRGESWEPRYQWPPRIGGSSGEACMPLNAASNQAPTQNLAQSKLLFICTQWCVHIISFRSQQLQ
jgi:hypothetical protein